MNKIEVLLENLKNQPPTLYNFSGLPGVGKSTIAKALARSLSAPYFRIDTVEQGLKDICGLSQVEGEGYRLSYRLVRDNLLLNNSVVADSVNPIELCRTEWDQLALSAGAKPLNIYVVCSDPTEHKHRVESRVTEVKNLAKPTWEQVIHREFHPWDQNKVLVIDSSKLDPDRAVERIVQSSKNY